MPSLESLLLGAWKDWRHQFRRCRRRASKGAVHQVRVDSRRLLAILSLYDAGGYRHIRPIRKVVKKTLEALSKLRDADVQVSDVKALLPEHPPAQPFLDYLGRRKRRLRKAARARLRHIGIGRAGRASERLAHGHATALPRSTGRLAKPAMNGAWEEVGQRLRNLDTSAPDTIHRVRVALKSVRYMLEAGIGLDALDPRLATLDGSEVVDAVRRMGQLHDAETLVRRLEKFADKRPVNSVAVASLRAALDRQHGPLLEQVMADVDVLRRIQSSTRVPRTVGAASARHTAQRRGR